MNTISSWALPPRTDPLAWRGVNAPSLADFETIAAQVYRNLPKTLRDLCDDLVIRIDDFPTDEVLDEMEIESPFDLLGLFQGASMRIRWARLSPTCWCTTSATTSASPTPTWRRSRRARDDGYHVI
jgi:hypothetical protein